MEVGAGNGVNFSHFEEVVALEPEPYGVLRVDPQHYFGPIGPTFLTRRASASSVHVHAAARVDGRWLKCDPSTDRDLASRT